MSVAARRWEEEAKFFDQSAERAAARLRPIDPLILERYRRSRALYVKELCLRLIGDLTQKRILDVGCGDGENSVLLARLGANVTGVDVSRGAVQVAERRAAMDGVTTQTSFLCSPIERLQGAGGFDVIWIDNCLHHVLPALEETL
jgi:2-polyprenyl-3-methyl-5-hydroxy-6-metoxy-1,4-benzoquinol methylase